MAELHSGGQPGADILCLRGGTFSDGAIPVRGPLHPAVRRFRLPTPGDCLGIQHSNLYMRARKVKEVNLIVYFQSKDQTVYHKEISQYQYHNINITISQVSPPLLYENDMRNDYMR